MDKLVDHLFIFEGDGVIRDYPGNYTQYRILEKSKQSLSSVSSDITTQKEHDVVAPKKEAIVTESTTKPAAAKMTFKEKSEWEQLNKEMPIMELKKAELVEQMNQSNLDYDAITKLSEDLSAITNQLEAAELRWLELSEKQ
jgi:ATP-binding cassette subfamily F protein uup